MGREYGFVLAAAAAMITPALAADQAAPSPAPDLQCPAKVGLFELLGTELRGAGMICGYELLCRRDQTTCRDAYARAGAALVPRTERMGIPVIRAQAAERGAPVTTPPLLGAAEAASYTYTSTPQNLTMTSAIWLKPQGNMVRAVTMESVGDAKAEVERFVSAFFTGAPAPPSRE